MLIRTTIICILSLFVLTGCDESNNVAWKVQNVDPGDTPQDLRFTHIEERQEYYDDSDDEDERRYERPRQYRKDRLYTPPGTYCSTYVAEYLRGIVKECPEPVLRHGRAHNPNQAPVYGTNRGARSVRIGKGVGGR